MYTVQRIIISFILSFWHFYLSYHVNPIQVIYVFITITGSISLLVDYWPLWISSAYKSVTKHKHGLLYILFIEMYCLFACLIDGFNNISITSRRLDYWWRKSKNHRPVVNLQLLYNVIIIKTKVLLPQE